MERAYSEIGEDTRLLADFERHIPLLEAELAEEAAEEQCRQQFIAQQQRERQARLAAE